MVYRISHSHHTYLTCRNLPTLYSAKFPFTLIMDFNFDSGDQVDNDVTSALSTMLIVSLTYYAYRKLNSPKKQKPQSYVCLAFEKEHSNGLKKWIFAAFIVSFSLLCSLLTVTFVNENFYQTLTVSAF